MKMLIIFLSLILSILTLPHIAAAEESPNRLSIATRHVPPFAIQNENGDWHGISIELWRQIADRLGFDYEFHEMGGGEG